MDTYYKALTKASNIVNINNGTEIDHLTITGLMSDDDAALHLFRIQQEAMDISPESYGLK